MTYYSIENTNPDYYKQELASRDALIERLIETAMASDGKN